MKMEYMDWISATALPENGMMNISSVRNFLEILKCRGFREREQYKKFMLILLNVPE